VQYTDTNLINNVGHSGIPIPRGEGKGRGFDEAIAKLLWALFELQVVHGFKITGHNYNEYLRETARFESE